MRSALGVFKFVGSPGSGKDGYMHVFHEEKEVTNPDGQVQEISWGKLARKLLAKALVSEPTAIFQNFIKLDGA